MNFDQPKKSFVILQFGKLWYDENNRTGADDGKNQARHTKIFVEYPDSDLWDEGQSLSPESETNYL